MKNIIKIFIKDLKSICTNFFPLLICGALVIIAPNRPNKGYQDLNESDS